VKRHSVLGVRRWHGLQTTGARPEFIALLQVVSAVAVQLPSSIELERATVSETVGGLAAAGTIRLEPIYNRIGSGEGPPLADWIRGQGKGIGGDGSRAVQDGDSDLPPRLKRAI